MKSDYKKVIHDLIMDLAYEDSKKYRFLIHDLEKIEEQLEELERSEEEER